MHPGGCQQVSLRTTAACDLRASWRPQASSTHAATSRSHTSPPGVFNGRASGGRPRGPRAAKNPPGGPLKPLRPRLRHAGDVTQPRSTCASASLDARTTRSASRVDSSGQGAIQRTRASTSMLAKGKCQQVKGKSLSFAATHLGSAAGVWIRRRRRG